MTRRVWMALVLVGVLAGLAIPVGAAGPMPQQATGGTQTITGSYTTTNPIYPLLNAETGILLYDLTGEIRQDFDFRLPLDGQVIGTIDGNIVKGDYTLELPDTPDGMLHDFDQDDTTPPVQVFAAATYINFLGDEYVNRGESALDLSVVLDPMTFRITGGYVIVWAAADGAVFPGDVGADATVFTADDDLIELAAGWSVVSLATDPFTVLRDDHVTIPVVESFGALNDYSDMSYGDAWEALFARTVETYPFTVEKNLDWSLIYDAITPLVAAAESDIEFHLAIAQLGRFIPDTHLSYVSLPLVQDYLLGAVGVNQLGVTDAGEVVVTAVGKNSAADKAGMQRGDVLLRIDGLPALQALDETDLLLMSASSAYTRRALQVGTMLLGPVNSPVTVAWQSVDGDEQSATLTRTMDPTALLSALGADALFSDVIQAHMLDSGLGYIRVTGFTSEVSRADAWFAEELQALIDGGAQGIIIDMRDNGGGLVQLAMSMSGHFFPDYERLFDFYYADGTGQFAYRGFVEILAHESYYDGPVAVLVNEMTGSAAEIFAYAMQIDGRAIIVGNTPSSGAAGEVGDGQYILPGGLQMQIPTGRSVNPATGAIIIEGVGVVPDVRVPVTYESLISADDEVLRAAEAALLGE
ncbi:MAG: hypothetical protein JXA10_04335 [Anaerolineae bacterium]|nr:hypothetical protein [Anaerolineae bacterium]